MKKVKILGMSLVVASVLGVGLTGCGGGSGGKNVGLAKPTLANALEVEDKMAKNQNKDVPNESRSLKNTNDNSHTNLALLTNKLTKRLSKHAKDVDLDSYSLNQALNEKIDCADGGSMSVNGYEDETDGSEFSITFNQCSEDDAIINGSVYFSFSNYDQKIEDYRKSTIKATSNLTMKSTREQKTSTLYAGSYFTINIIDSQNYEVLTNLKATEGDELKELKYCTFYFKENGSTIEMYQTQGKVYINDLSAYVEYDTSYDMSKTPFVFNDYNEDPISGEIRYIMADNAKMKIVVESRTEPVTYIDVDGDGRFDGVDDLNEKDDPIEPSEKGAGTTSPKPDTFNKEMSQKNYVVIVKNTQSSVCSIDYLKSEGLINPIYKEVPSSTTCATYNKTADGSEYSECMVVNGEPPYKGNVTCAVGFDD